MNRLRETMTLLIASDGQLPAEWLGHPLTDDWAGHRECHIGGDFLLVYRLDDAGKKPGSVCRVWVTQNTPQVSAFTVERCPPS